MIKTRLLIGCLLGAITLITQAVAERTPMKLTSDSRVLRWSRMHRIMWCQLMAHLLPPRKLRLDCMRRLRMSKTAILERGRSLLVILYPICYL